MADVLELIILSHNEHTHQLLESTWVDPQAVQVVAREEVAAEVEVVTGPGLDLDPDLGQDQDHHITVKWLLAITIQTDIVKLHGKFSSDSLFVT